VGVNLSAKPGAGHRNENGFTAAAANGDDGAIAAVLFFCFRA